MTKIEIGGREIKFLLDDLPSDPPQIQMDTVNALIILNLEVKNVTRH